jgi:hypothetical protein
MTETSTVTPLDFSDDRHIMLRLVLNACFSADSFFSSNSHFSWQVLHY